MNIRFRGFIFELYIYLKCVFFIIFVSYMDTYALNNHHNRIMIGYKVPKYALKGIRKESQLDSLVDL